MSKHPPEIRREKDVCESLFSHLYMVESRDFTHTPSFPWGKKNLSNHKKSLELVKKFYGFFQLFFLTVSTKKERIFLSIIFIITIQGNNLVSK